MSAHGVMENKVDPDGKSLYRVGGISAIVFVIAYFVIIVLYVPVGKPGGAEAWLMSMAENTNTWWAILGLSVLTDFLLVPVALSLYIVLKGINKNAMLAAIAFIGLFVILDLALTWTNYASLIAISGNYAAASNNTQRAMIVTAATYPSSVVDSNLLFVYNSLTLAIGIFMTGLVMLRGIFNKFTAYLGLATGILGMVAVAGSFFGVLSAMIILVSVLTMVWVFFVGYRLYRLGQS
jgi:hypothetical protein